MFMITECFSFILLRLFVSLQLIRKSIYSIDCCVGELAFPAYYGVLRKLQSVSGISVVFLTLFSLCD